MPNDFIRTETVLDQILEHKLGELTSAQVRVPFAQVMTMAESAPPPRDMLAALRRDMVALIAEVKHASPSKGVLIEPFDPVALGKVYAQNGAAVISVLTDERFFLGHLDYLRAVKDAVEIPVLRKDFVIDPYQVYEGRAAGADAILLIVAALADSQLAELHRLILDLGMVALVEVHNEAELERALHLAPPLIGINNRDLKTFHVDLDTTARIALLVPDDVILVAESGIRDGNDVRRMGQMGAHAVLVGEALVQAPDTALHVQEMSRQLREVIP
jgi:indole-3-glycerol phosphate synthase